MLIVLLQILTAWLSILALGVTWLFYVKPGERGKRLAVADERARAASPSYRVGALVLYLDALPAYREARRSA